MAKETGLVKKGDVGLTVPEHLDKYKKDTRGTEHLEKKDVKMPRLSIAQKMSAQIESSSTKYIEDLEFLDLFNDLTGEIYRERPLQFTIIKADPPRAIEFVPMDEGGGIRDFNVPMSDARTQWHGNERPLATVFYDYVLALLPSREPIVLSLKSTNLKTARQLNGLMKLRGLPCFTGLYELTVTKEANDKGQTWGTYTIRNAGFVDAETAAWGEEAYEGLKDKAIEIDREPEDNIADAEVVDDSKSEF